MLLQLPVLTSQISPGLQSKIPVLTSQISPGLQSKIPVLTRQISPGLQSKTKHSQHNSSVVKDRYNHQYGHE
ncbi:hypothetical protein H5410_035687 [Solanum commersonii]|uniref:Uncharacterized protein n=1 Tax=Solanum commersonii TaxID=4109 RepID=A0A9J5Y3J9_SOLCO|nr:hypothetical protein H5410_035687 [Solanum commersonii]